MEIKKANSQKPMSNSRNYRPARSALFLVSLFFQQADESHSIGLH